MAPSLPPPPPPTYTLHIIWYNTVYFRLKARMEVLEDPSLLPNSPLPLHILYCRLRAGREEPSSLPSPFPSVHILYCRLRACREKPYLLPNSPLSVHILYHRWRAGREEPSLLLNPSLSVHILYNRFRADREEPSLLPSPFPSVHILYCRLRAGREEPSLLPSPPSVWPFTWMDSFFRVSHLSHTPIRYTLTLDFITVRHAYLSGLLDFWLAADTIASTLQRKSDFCIPRKETSRPQSRFPHSCFCGRYIPTIGHLFSCSRIGQAVSFLGIFVSNFWFSVFAV